MRSVVLIAFLFAGGATAFAQEAWQVFQKARDAEKHGKTVDAYLLYSQAAAMDPANAKYRVFSQALQKQAVIQSKAPLPASTEVAETSAPDGLLGNITDDELKEARKPQPPRILNATPGNKSFEFKGDSKSLYEKVTKLFGLDVVFDGDYQPSPPIRFQLDNVDYRSALHALEAATGTFVIPISEKLIMAAKDTPQKRQELEPTVAVVIAVPNTVAIQEAQELVRTVQQTFDIQKMMLDSEQRLLLVRDRLSKVYPAEKVLEQLIVYSGQVHVDVEFVAINKRASYTYGLRLQQIFNLSPIINKNPTSYLARMLGGTASVGIVIANSGIFASMSQSEARTILKAEVTSMDGKAATIHIGDKYPIISSGYYGTGSSTGGNQYTPPPTFNFEDLGVVIKLTPFIHGTDDITVEVEAEYKVLTGAVTDGIPVIANRKIQSRVRLADGQSGVIAGLITSSRSRGWNGLAGVASLPVVGPFLRENTRDRDDEEVIMVIKPTLVGLPPGEIGMKPVWLGSETRPLSWL